MTATISLHHTFDPSTPCIMSSPGSSRLSTLARHMPTHPLPLPSRTMWTPSKPSLAILDDYASIATPKFAHLAPRLTLASFPRTLPPPTSDEHKAALVARLRPFAVLACMRERTPLPGDVIAQLPNLKLVITSGPKNAAIDVAACTERGIVVAGSPPPEKKEEEGGIPRLAPSLESTKEHTWALILGLARDIARGDAAVQAGGWQTSLATGLAGKTLCVLGLGRVGAAVAHIGAVAFGMRVVAWSSSLTQGRADEAARAYGLPAGTFAVAASKEALCRAADVLSVHVVLSERSRGMIGGKELGWMKGTALLVNTARGALVEEEGLLACLRRGGIAGVGLDVFEREPLGEGSEWRSGGGGEGGRGRVLLSPHMGYAEEGVMGGWYAEAVENVERWLDGREVVGRLN
ncbi:hypothetical protein MMC13_002644 [Lambiella insularis]|nr:hypothetical protein [Lambiella insularis]